MFTVSGLKRRYKKPKNSVLQDISPCTLLQICFVCHINAAEASVVTGMRSDLEDDASTGPIRHPPSYGKDQLPNSERKSSQINLLLVKHETKVSAAQSYLLRK
jgi:hypothetical protein